MAKDCWDGIGKAGRSGRCSCTGKNDGKNGIGTACAACMFLCLFIE